MKRCILPFTIDVEMKAYQNKAFPLGIFKATMPDYDVWLCNKLIIPICYPWNFFDTLSEDLWSVNDGLSNCQFIELEPKTFNSKAFDILRLNKEMLQSGLYITGTYNEFFIKGKRVYMKRDFPHDYIIFGYDDEKNAFLSAGYLADGSYSIFDIDYEAYYTSIVENNTATRSCLYYHQINKDYIPSIDIRTIKTRLGDYLHSQYSNPQANPEYFYGLSAWDKFVEYTGSIGEKNLDYRYSRIYMEHRAIMVKRMHKLYELDFLSDGDIVEEYYQNVYRPAQATHNLFMKYNLTRNANVLSRITELMKASNAIEAELLRKMIDSLKITK